MSLPPLYERVIVPTSPLAIPGLLVKRTRLKKGKRRLDFHGLFTTHDLPAYTFLGYYAGHFYDEAASSDDEDPADPPPPSHYAVNGSGYTVVPPGERTARGVDPRVYPLAMMNEPPRGTASNVDVVEWTTAKDAVPGVPPSTRVGVLAVHTCRAVAAGEELYFHYGDAYDRRHYGRRPYNVGRKCDPIGRQRVPAEQRPRQVLLRLGVERIPRDEAYIEFG